MAPEQASASPEEAGALLRALKAAALGQNPDLAVSTSDTWINPLLGAWLSSLLGEASTPLLGEISVTFGPPGPDGGPASQAGRTRQGINLHLLSIAPHARATTRTVDEVTLPPNWLFCAGPHALEVRGEDEG